MKIVAEAYFGLRFSSESNDRSISKMIEEIQDLTNYFKIDLKNFGIIDRISFQYLTEYPALPTKKRFFENGCSLFLMKMSFDDELLDGLYLVIKYHIEKRIRDLIIALSISKNGLADCVGAQIFFDQKLVHEMPLLIHTVDLAINGARKFKWPTLKKVSLKQTWLWYEGFFDETDGVSSSNVGRALNAYSNVFSNKSGEDNHAALFWALLGIEAIYANGKENIQQQVNEHTELFLGERKEFKKSFKDLYDFRSRFIHGDMDVHNQFVLQNLTERFEKTLFELYDATGYAVTILVATFQKLIQKNKQQITFKKTSKTVVSF